MWECFFEVHAKFFDGWRVFAICSFSRVLLIFWNPRCLSSRGRMLVVPRILSVSWGSALVAAITCIIPSRPMVKLVCTDRDVVQVGDPVIVQIWRTTEFALSSPCEGAQPFVQWITPQSPKTTGAYSFYHSRNYTYLISSPRESCRIADFSYNGRDINWQLTKQEYSIPMAIVLAEPLIRSNYNLLEIPVRNYVISVPG